MKGITEERLREKLKQYNPPNGYATLLDLIDECTEINPWQPIDENTPKDRPVLLYVSVGPISCRQFVGNAYDSWYWKPTHWQELPEDPK